MEHLVDTPWSRIGEFLFELRDRAAENQGLAASIVLIFHGGRLSGVLETPTFFEDTADDITDELCRFLPSVNADQLAIVFPGCFDLDGQSLWHLQAHLWERARPDEVFTRIVPIPVGAWPDTEPFDRPLVDSHSRRIAASLSASAVVPTVHTYFPPGYSLGVRPGGALDVGMPLQTLN